MLGTPGSRRTVARYRGGRIGSAGRPITIGTLATAMRHAANSSEIAELALRHRDYDIHGIQFHPESVLTPQGGTIVSNWLAL